MGPRKEPRAAYHRLSDFRLPRAILEVRSGHHRPLLIPRSDLIAIHCLQSDDAKQKHTHRLQDVFYDGLAGWAKSHPDKVVEEDVHDIAKLSQALYVAFFRLRDSVTNNAAELPRRRALDDLVEMAFMGRKGSIHSVAYVTSVADVVGVSFVFYQS